MCVPRGNLAPRGAVLKPGRDRGTVAARGRAVVFENLADYKARIVDPALEVTPDSVRRWKNCAPGLPGHGRGRPAAQAAGRGRDRHGAYLGCAMQRHRLRHGGAARRPRGARGGPLAVVRDGDWIELDCAGGRLHLDISDAELQSRLAQWNNTRVAHPDDAAGYPQALRRARAQADEGCDFDSSSAAAAPRAGALRTTHRDDRRAPHDKRRDVFPVARMMSPRSLTRRASSGCVDFMIDAGSNGLASSPTSPRVRRSPTTGARC